MSTDNGAALAVRELSMEQIEQRIDLNKKSGWGLEKGTTAQLSLLALYCQKYRLLPGDDVTLYDGKPWLTIDGRVKLMRRNRDEYRGHSTRPLTREEKETWGYDVDDLVIEATIRTATYGAISARGKVSKAERIGSGAGRLNPVAKVHPVEMAEKRALSRAERFAFGTESFVDDEDVDEAVRSVIEERQDPDRQRALAAQYDKTYGSEEAGSVYDLPSQTAPAEAPPKERAGGRRKNEDTVTSIDDPLYQRYADVYEEAQALEVEAEVIQLPISVGELSQLGRDLADRVAIAKRARETTAEEVAAV